MDIGVYLLQLGHLLGPPGRGVLLDDGLSVRPVQRRLLSGLHPSALGPKNRLGPSLDLRPRGNAEDSRGGAGSLILLLDESGLGSSLLMSRHRAVPHHVPKKPSQRTRPPRIGINYYPDIPIYLY